jgi:predicted nucleic acid-binding protein
VAKAVCDAGPLIHLSDIGQSGLLRQFSPLIIPEVVFQEASSFQSPSDLKYELVDVSLEARTALERRLLVRLQAGEIDALVWCNS